MSETGDERLAAMLRELEKQDAEWARVREKLAALGDVHLAVPNEALEAIAETCRVSEPMPQGMRA
jgi:hypothetical protein